MALQYGGIDRYEVTEGDSLKVEIEISGFPIPSESSWMSDTSGEITLGGDVTGLGVNLLEFSQVLRSDSGTYTVSTSNCAGSISFQLQIIVLCESS